jgi:hypothetical protein
MSEFVIIAAVTSFIVLCLAVVGVYWWHSKAREDQRRVVTVFYMGIPFRFTYWHGLDENKLKECLLLAIGALNAVWSTTNMYALLDGVHVNVMTSPTWSDPFTGRTIAGQSLPSSKTVVVGSDYAALAHELAHVIEAGPGRLGFEDHASWASSGIQAAVDKYEGQLKR